MEDQMPLVVSPRGRTCFYDPATHVWSGLPRPSLFNPAQSLGQLVLEVLERSDADHPSQLSADIAGGRVVTCGEMRLRTIRVAQHLTRRGLGASGSMAALVSRNGEHVAPVAFACFTLGVTLNTLDPAFTCDDFAHMFGITRPTLVFCESGILEAVRAGASSAGLDPTYVLFEEHVQGYQHVEELLEHTGTEHLFVPPTLDDPASALAAVLCSSGTTGLPKGVSYTHTFCVTNLPTLWRMSPGDSVLAYSSLYWLSGFASLIIGTVAQATRIITREPFEPKAALELLQRLRITIAFFSPYQSTLIAHEPALKTAQLGALRLLICGGARVSKELYQALRTSLPSHTAIQIGYGMSESCLVSITDGTSYRDDCVGTLQARTQAMIVESVDDAGDEGEPVRALPPGSLGEIMLRVQVPFAGYYRNPEATAATIGTDGWIRTGDIGHFDADGHLYIVDRKKDIIKYAGFQISPTELEALIKLLPGVLECCVVGVPGQGCDLPAALVMRAPGPPGAALNAACVERHVRERVTDYKRLRGGVFFASELPLTPSGKVVRRKCLELVLGQRDALEDGSSSEKRKQ